MIKDLNKKMKKINVWDVALVKAAVAVGILFVIRIWPAAMTLVHSINPWYFFVAFVIFTARPFYKFWLK